MHKFLKKIYSIKEECGKKIIRFLGIKLTLNYAEKSSRKNRKKQLLTLSRLRNEIKKRKLKIAFLIIENQKWNSTELYNLLKKSNLFEPYIVVTQFRESRLKKEIGRLSIDKNVDFFKERGFNIVTAYNENTNEYIDINSFGFDIIFYSSPWMNEDYNPNQQIEIASKQSICCYIPYAIAEAPSSMALNKYFFKSIMKHYIVSHELIDEYKKIVKHNENSIVVTGHPKLDVYTHSNNTVQNNKTIIYAPHFSIGKKFFSVGTFDWNGKYILNYAKKHPEFNWIFKPHPMLKTSFLREKIMTEQELNNYYNDWANIGSVYEYGDYFDLFKQSDVMITDCASFLLEYYPTQKPIIRLLSKNYTYNNCLTEKIASNYYNVHNLKELKNTFKTVIENSEDRFREKRLKYISKFQPYADLASYKIYNDLIKMFGVTND